MPQEKITLKRSVIEELFRTAKEASTLSNTTIQVVENELEERNSDETVYTGDLENELYGYGVFNTRENSLIAIPNESRTTTHVVSDWNNNLLKEITRAYGFDSIQHLRVVEIRLANAIDKHEAKTYNTT